MNMITEEKATLQPILTNPMPLPKKPKVTLWDWIKYYAYNYSRKPKVWLKQRELQQIFNKVQEDLDNQVYRKLEFEMFSCGACRDGYGALKPQRFLSQIETILKMMKCGNHPQYFNNFLITHQEDFRKSEEIAKWINGFSK